MSQRNRSTLAALVLGAALILTTPTPAGAAGLQPGRIPALGVLNRAWDWLAGLLVPDGFNSSSSQTARWEKEGGAIDPNGRPIPSSPPPSNTTTQVTGASTLEGVK